MKTILSPRIILLMLACLAFPMSARAQMGDVGMAMGAAGVLSSNPIAQQSQMTQQAAATASGQTPGITATPAPAAAGSAAPGVPAAATPAVPATPDAAVPAAAATAPPVDLHAPFKQSLFFSPQDIIAIQKAIKGQTRSGGPIGEATPVIPMRRFITVSGISYKSPDNWVVWINGQKVVPNGLGVLKELVEMDVHKDYVRLKWFDIGANNTLNITMRPNQTYYIVEGVRVPGPAVP